MFFLILFKLLIFWAVLIFFAWQIMRLVLKHEPRELLITLSLVAGPIFYIFTLNILATFSPLLFIFLCLSRLLDYRVYPVPFLSPQQRKKFLAFG